MHVSQEFKPLALEDLLTTCKEYKEKGYRLTQILPKLERDDSITLIYTFVMGAEMVNFKVTGIIKGETVVPSVTEMFIACFVYENEAHDLFGVNVEGNLLDFQGKFYSFGEGIETPMTIITPEQLAAREKAAKLASAKAARAAKAKAAKENGSASAQKPAASSTGPSQAEIEAKLAGMDPEKAAKVRAAMEAKAKKAAAKAQASAEPCTSSSVSSPQSVTVPDDFEERLTAMDPEKAAKVRAAMEAKKKREAARATSSESVQEGE